jgi:predicted protein tyrosine phosphatase
MPINILFICSRNQWRSKTAEDLFKNTNGLNVRSAGTASAARIRVNDKMIDWAELIFVMEKHHKQLIIQKFPLSSQGKQFIVLDIPDEYQYMDTELIDMLQRGVDRYL